MTSCSQVGVYRQPSSSSTDYFIIEDLAEKYPKEAFEKYLAEDFSYSDDINFYLSMNSRDEVSSSQKSRFMLKSLSKFDTGNSYIASSAHMRFLRDFHELFSDDRNYDQLVNYIETTKNTEAFVRFVLSYDYFLSSTSVMNSNTKKIYSYALFKIIESPFGVNGGRVELKKTLSDSFAIKKYPKKYHSSNLEMYQNFKLDAILSHWNRIKSNWSLSDRVLYIELNNIFTRPITVDGGLIYTYDYHSHYESKSKRVFGDARYIPMLSLKHLTNKCVSSLEKLFKR